MQQAKNTPKEGFESRGQELDFLLVKAKRKGPLRVFAFTTMLALMFQVGTPSAHALIIATNSFTEVTVDVITPNSTDDVVVNCDMLEDPNGVMKAVAYSLMQPNYPSTTSTCSLYVEDYNNNTDIVTLGTYAMQPDVVLSHGIREDGTFGDYKALVVYHKYNLGAEEAWLDVWDLVNVGSPSFAASFNTRVQLSNRSDGFPHIDMWSDANSTVNGLPSMHQFAIVWGEAGELMYYVADVSNPTVSTPFPIGDPANFGAYMPDVACLTDIPTGHQKMQLTFAQGFGLPYANTYGLDLRYSEFNYTTGLPAIVVPGTWLDNGGTYAPKIEAMSQYDTTAGYVKWQVAASVGGPPSKVAGFNNFLLGATDMSSLLSVLYSNPPWTFYAAMGACVAAGTGPTINGSNIGNNQYSLGFEPWQHDSLYARHIGGTTGTLINSSDAYLVNTTNTSTGYHWDLNQSMAMSNCSNSGLDLLTAWATSEGIVYKYSFTNTWAFKSTGVNQSKAKVQIAYPNPALNELRIADDRDGTISVSDVKGRIVLQQTHKSGESINLSKLVNGNYILKCVGSDKKTSVVQFTKQ